MKTYHLDINKKAYEGKSKQEFLDAEKHHANERGVDLSAEYDKMFPPAPKEEKKKAE